MDTREQLQATLKELEEELASLDTLDAETRQMLEDAAREIHEKLDKNGIRPQPSDSVANRLRDAIDSFESSHPTLTGILSRITDALAQLGI